MPKKAVILGGGLTGLSCGWKLNQNGYEVTIIEKDNTVGGISGSEPKNGYIFDYGAHAYHSRVPYLLETFKELAGPEFRKVLKLHRVNFMGSYYKYPLEAVDIIKKMKFATALSCFWDYFSQVIKRKFQKPQDNNAEEWIVNRFGWTLYNFFFRDYTTKVWGVPPSQLSALFARHRIPYISLWSLAKKSFMKGVHKLTRWEHRYAPLVIEMYYPAKGSGVIPEKIAQKIRDQKGQIHLESEVIQIKRQQNIITSVTINHKGKPETIPGDVFVSTIPVNELILGLEPPAEMPVAEVAQKLAFRAMVIACLVVNKEKVLDFPSVYYTNKFFTRLTSLNNYCLDVPAGKTQLMAEIHCAFEGEIWKAKEAEIIDRVGEELVKESFIKKSEVDFGFLLKIKHAYPIYKVGYENHMNLIMQYLNKFENLYSSGRQGLFKYVDMDVAVEMGFETAKFILSGQNKDKVKNISFEERLFI